MHLETTRLLITDFTPAMARAVHLVSLDADTRQFLPDEVFETEEIAANVIADLMDCYHTSEGPFVHPCLLKDGTYIGYVQLIPMDEGFEVGYHIVSRYTGMGYATEAVSAFVPHMMEKKRLRRMLGVCDADNAASIRVLEKCGFRRVFEGVAPYQGSMRPVVKLICER